MQKGYIERQKNKLKSVSIRYSEASCDTLVPTPTEENYAGFNLGPTTEVNDILSENEDSAFDSPKELTSRNPPFDIQLTFSRYRAGKEYESKLNIQSKMH